MDPVLVLGPVKSSSIVAAITEDEVYELECCHGSHDVTDIGICNHVQSYSTRIPSLPKTAPKFSRASPECLKNSNVISRLW